MKLLVTANFVSNSLILSTLMMDALRFSVMSVLTRASRRHIPEDGIILTGRMLLWGCSLVSVELAPNVCP
jgi:hypothetical protein